MIFCRLYRYGIQKETPEWCLDYCVLYLSIPYRLHNCQRPPTHAGRSLPIWLPACCAKGAVQTLAGQGPRLARITEIDGDGGSRTTESEYRALYEHTSPRQDCQAGRCLLQSSYNVPITGRQIWIYATTTLLWKTTHCLPRCSQAEINI